jgi:translation initiation factor IF-2
MNVTELARKLNMNTKELLEKLPELGFDIGKKAIKIDPGLVDKIVKAVEDDRKVKKMVSQEGLIKEIKLGDKDKPAVKAEKFIKIPQTIIVNEMAKKMNLPAGKLIAELFKNGIMATLNERIDFETALIIGEDLGYKVEKFTEEELYQQQDVAAEQKLKELIKDRGKELQPRPPVVVVMGHVDHGKTKLLDAIRQTNVVDQEAGGITQHIGAYQIIEKGKYITFLDTPGHEAFKAMRSRGGKIADVSIIVIAADDGLKQQTLEVIQIAQKENLPFIIAINKIDKEGADVERVKKELSEINLLPEDWGGKTICVPISAKQKIGIPELLDMVLLVSDMEQLKADSTLEAVGTIIETHIDKGEGPVATVLIQSGTLKLGDLVVVGEVAGRIKAMKDYRGNLVQQAPPSMPVRILGLKQTPAVGDILEVTADKKKIKEIIKQSSYKKIESTHTKTSTKEEPKDSDEEEKSRPKLNIVLKCDVLGSLEAIVEALGKFVDPDVKLTIVKKGLGNVTEADVLAAESAQGLVIAFHVPILPPVEILAKDKGIEVLHYDIIYKLLEDIEDRLKKMPPDVVRTELGTIQVLALFRTEKNGMIVGGKILEGRIKPDTKVKVIRDGETVIVSDLIQLRSGKQVLTEAVKGEDCGLSIKGNPVIKVNDVLEVYKEEVKRREAPVSVPVRVGEAEKTTFPVPVSSVRIPASSEEVSISVERRTAASK